MEWLPLTLLRVSQLSIFFSSQPSILRIMQCPYPPALLNNLDVTHSPPSNVLLLLLLFITNVVIQTIYSYDLGEPLPFPFGTIWKLASLHTLTCNLQISGVDSSVGGVKKTMYRIVPDSITNIYGGYCK